jgi:hypothetical protein
VHKRVTSAENDNVIGKIDKIRETWLQFGPNPLIFYMYIGVAISYAMSDLRGGRVERQMLEKP